MAKTQTSTPRYEAFIKLDTGTHTSDIRQLALSSDGRTLLSAGEGTVRVWDLASRQLRRLLLGEMAGEADEALGNGDVRRFAISRDGTWAVVLRGWFGLPERGSDGGRVTEVQVFEIATGNLQACFVFPGLLFDLAFSPDGRLLTMVGNRCHGRKRQGLVLVYSARAVIRAGFDRPPLPLAQARCGQAARHGELPLALRFVPNLPRAGHAMVVAGRPVPAPAKGRHGTADPSFLAWYRYDGASLVLEWQVDTPVAIDPLTFAVSHPFVVVGAAAPSRRRKRNWGRLLCFDGRGQPLGELTTEAVPASAAFSPDGSRLLVGLSVVTRRGELPPTPGEQTVQVNAYDTHGGCFDLRSTYFGHDATITALAFIDNEHVVSSGGDNQALHFWHCGHRIGRLESAIRGVGQTCYAPGIDARESVFFGAVPMRLLPVNHAPRQQAFCLRSMTLQTTRPSAVRNDYESRKWFIMDNTAQTIPLRYSPSAYGDALDLPPDLTLFVGTDDEWVIWTRSGYYDASPGGAARIGYHVNRGPHKEALFFPSDRFKAFYRPDLVAAVVQHGSEDRARQKGVKIPELDVASQLPPIVEFDRQGIALAGDQVTLRFSAEVLGTAEPLTRVWVLKNDRFAWSHAVPAGRTRSRHAVTLRLGPGRNVFSIRAETAQAKSLPLVHEVVGPTGSSASAASDATARGNLYLLSVGVSDFAVADTPEAGAFKRLHAAHLDAVAVHNALAASTLPPKASSRRTRRVERKLALGNKAFDGVKARLLVNEQATKAAILAALDELCAEIAQRHQQDGAERDVLFVFLSGHGVRFAGEPDLYFWNHDLRPSRMEETGLSLVELGERVTSVPAEVVVAIDACHAGMAGNNVMRSLDAEELARRIHAVNERGLYVMNAARAEEKAREDRHAGVGIFTGAMLATLASKRFVAPDPGDGGSALAMLGLIAGVQHFVPQLSAEAQTRPQTPVCRMYGDLLPLTIYKS